MMRAWLVCCAVLSALLLGRSDAVAQAYPVKPVRIIVPLAAGGLADILARVVAQRLGEVSGQYFVVENRTGAAGAVGGEAAARAPGDGIRCSSAAKASTRSCRISPA